MPNMLAVVVLQLLGVIVALAEFVTPSFGILTATAMASFGFSLYLLWIDVSHMAAILVGIADLALVPALIWIGVRVIARSPVSLRSQLDRHSGSVSQDLELEKLVGHSGTALTNLRPAGRALIDDRRLDVVTTGDFIEINAPIVVSEVNGNRIVVKPKQP